MRKKTKNIQRCVKKSLATEEKKNKDTSEGNTYKHTVKINLTTYGIEKLA